MRASPMPPSVPGFAIERPLGRDDGGLVHLARQRVLGRLVALKFAPGELAADAEFRRRFLADAAARRRMRHPGIARIHAVAAQESALYSAVEYLAGGNLRQRLQRGLRLADLAGLMQDIGAALDHAHDKGLLHLDLRPENILFRADGRAVLSDFSLACAIEEERLPARYAAAIGKPPYASPEQVDGRMLDGRADLYGLAVVCYEILTGNAPSQGDGTVSARVQPLPFSSSRLPGQLAALQPIMDHALARNPEQRFPSGATFAAALEKASNAGTLADLRFRCGVVTAQEIHVAGGGQLPAAGDAERSDPPYRRRQVARRSAAVLLLAAVLALAGHFVYTQPALVAALLAEIGLGEDPLTQTAWADAQSLHQDPNQSLSAIVAGYRHVLTLDSAHEPAAQALASLAAQWRESVAESLSKNDLAQAETKLTELGNAFPEDPSLQDLERKVANHKAADRLLATTRALLRTRLPSDMPSAAAAIQTYREVMRLAPGHPVARQELAALAEHYAGLAKQAVERGDVPEAIGYLERATAADELLPTLASVRAEIQRAAATQAALEELLQQAGAYRAQGFLVGPQGRNAAEFYHRVLSAAPDNVIAQQGLDELTSQLLSNASHMLEEGALAEAQLLIDQASAAGFAPDALSGIRAQLEQKANRMASAQRNLRDAQALLAQGFVTEPPERNAVALLREVERLDPGNAQAATLLAQASARLAAAATEAYDAGLEEEARHYLELALTVTPDVPIWRELRASWE